VPSTSFDTFFACIIIVTASLIATAFVASTLQTGIASSQDDNKQSYLRAIADHIITNPGDPGNWGISSTVPADFGLAASPITIPYEVDLDKISRLNGLNNGSLSYFNMANAAKLNNIALGIEFSQVMFIDLVQLSNSTVGNGTSFTFSVLTSVESKPVSASLHSYAVANGFVGNIVTNTSGVGIGNLTVQIPSATADNALLIVFARATYDDRVTSYAVYNFQDSTQKSTPSNNVLTLSPNNYTLTFASNSSEIAAQSGYLFSYAYQQNLVNIQVSEYAIPNVIDKSPFILVVCGQSEGIYFQEWVAYPQVPLKSGSTFEGSEQNVFGYLVTVKGVLYRLEISLGDVPP
jgi:hypothetical protein